jgi:acyl dehydratase
MTVHERPFGRYFEDFEPGDVYKHWPGKTITEYDDHLFCMITMNHHPLHTDAWFAETQTQFGKNVVVGNLVYSLVLGMSVPDVSGVAIANLEVESLQHKLPTFHGDTIYGTRCSTRGVAEQDRPRRRHGRVVATTRGEEVSLLPPKAMVGAVAPSSTPIRVAVRRNLRRSAKFGSDCWLPCGPLDRELPSSVLRLPTSRRPVARGRSTSVPPSGTLEEVHRYPGPLTGLLIIAVVNLTGSSAPTVLRRPSLVILFYIVGLILTIGISTLLMVTALGRPIREGVLTDHLRPFIVGSILYIIVGSVSSRHHPGTIAAIMLASTASTYSTKG